MSSIHIDPARVIAPVDPRIYSGFTEHMGRCIYGGIYEPENPNGLSDPKTGFRLDVMDVLKELKIPVVRYPGGYVIHHCIGSQTHHSRAGTLLVVIDGKMALAPKNCVPDARSSPGFRKKATNLARTSSSSGVALWAPNLTSVSIWVLVLSKTHLPGWNTAIGLRVSLMLPGTVNICFKLG